MARLVTGSTGSFERRASRVVIHSASKKPMATRVPYVGIKNRPMVISLGNILFLTSGLLRHLRGGILALARVPHIEQQEASTGRDSGIGDVEIREIIGLAGVQLDEIRDGAVDDAIVQIAERAAQHDRETRAQQPRMRTIAGLQQDEGNRHQHHDGETDQQNVMPGARLVSEKAEGDARVFGMHDVEESGNDYVRRIPKRDVGFDEQFGNAVEQNDGDSNRKWRKTPTHVALISW